MVKVTFVGCAGKQGGHYKHLSAMSDVKIVGHCDVDRAHAEDAAKRFGGEAFTNCERMYDKVKPDAVYICVPPFAHTGMEEDAAKRGIHLFIERPLALDCIAAKRTAAAIRRAKIITSVGYSWRYYKTVAMAREKLNGAAVSLVNGWWNGGLPSPWWWRRMSKSGGQIMAQTTDVFDLLRHLCGDVAEVYAVASTGCMSKVKDYDIHDSSVVSLRLKSGATACITSSCVANHGGRVGLEIVTPEATLSFSRGKLVIKEDGKTTEFLPKVDTGAEENKAFIEAVHTGRKNKIKSTYSDAVKTFLVTWAANESIQSGMPVKP